MLVRGLGAEPLIDLVGKGSTGIDQRLGTNGELAPGHHVARARDPDSVFALCAQRLDVVGGDAAVVQRRADKAEDEARVVVVQVGVGVFEASVELAQVDDRLFARHLLGRQEPGPPGEAAADEPVEPAACEQLPEPVPEASRVRGVEADLLHRGRIGAQELVPRAAELAHQRELERLHVFDAAPGKVRRALAGDGGEVAAIDERHPGAAGRERRSAHRAVDAAAQDQHVERGGL